MRPTHLVILETTESEHMPLLRQLKDSGFKVQVQGHAGGKVAPERAWTVALELDRKGSSIAKVTKEIQKVLAKGDHVVSQTMVREIARATVLQLCKDCGIEERYVSPAGARSSYCQACMNKRSNAGHGATRTSPEVRAKHSASSKRSQERRRKRERAEMRAEILAELAAAAKS